MCLIGDAFVLSKEPAQQRVGVTCPNEMEVQTRRIFARVNKTTRCRTSAHAHDTPALRLVTFPHGFQRMRVSCAHLLSHALQSDTCNVRGVESLFVSCCNRLAFVADRLLVSQRRACRRCSARRFHAQSRRRERIERAACRSNAPRSCRPTRRDDRSPVWL